MVRMHLFEWEDQVWFPAVFRDNMTDFLRNIILWLKIYDSTVEILDGIITKTGEKTVIDLCSGAGGGIENIESKLNIDKETKIKIILTDKFPNTESINKFKNHETIEYYPESVDASTVPSGLIGVRTLFSSFHHFKPEAARNILKDAVNKNMPIAIFEGAGKTIVEFISFLILFPVLIFLITPFIKPFKWSRLIFTYVIPLLPFFIYWDGLVSIVRMNNISDLISLTKSLEDNYSWQAGKIKGKTITVTYLTGTPVK